MAKTSISRAQFLRGDYRGREMIIRPPWTQAENRFTERCTRCDRCIGACPEQILQRGRGGFPQVDFSRGECTFCQKCREACEADAFVSTAQPAWELHIHISERCLSKNGVVCVTCAEQCEQEAIHFLPQAGNVPQPHLEPAACNGCGACYRPCPAGAIQFQKSRAVIDEQLSQQVEVYP